MSVRRLRVPLLALLALACLHFATTAGAYSIDGDPAIVSESPAVFDIFARGNLSDTASDHQQGHLFHQSFNGTYWGWTDLGQPSPSVTVVGKPSAVSWGAGHVDVFVRGSDDYIYHRWFGSGGWWPWERVSNFHTDVSPTAFSWSANRIDVFGRNVNDRSLMHSWYQAGSNNNAFSDGESLGGVLGSGASVISWQPNHLDIFVRWGSNGLLAHKYWDGGWSAWQALSSSSILPNTMPSVVQWGYGAIQAFFTRESDHHMMMVPFAYGGWSTEQDFDGYLTSSPVAVSPHAGATDVFSRGTDGSVYHRWEDLSANYGWQWWSYVSNIQYTDSDPAAAAGGGYFSVVARNGGSVSGVVNAMCCLGGWSPWTYIAPPQDPDTRPPTVTLGGELAGYDGADVYDNYSYDVTATATDNRGVAGVTMDAQVDGRSFGSSVGESSHTFSLNVGDQSLAYGPHTVKIVARDASNNSSTSTTITINKDSYDPNDKDVKTEADDNTPTGGLGGTCGFGTSDCPGADPGGSSVTDHVAYAASDSHGTTQVYGHADDWLGLSEQKGPKIPAVLSTVGNNLHFFRLMPTWDVESGRSGSGLRAGQYQNALQYVANLGLATDTNIPRSGRQLLVSFDHDLAKSAPRNAPSLSDYENMVRGFVLDPAFANIDYYTAWNEPNLKGNPTGVIRGNHNLNRQHADRAADYYRILSLACHDRTPTPCHVLAGDFADNNGGAWFDEWRDEYIRSSIDPDRPAGHVVVGPNGISGLYYPRITSWAVHLHAESNGARGTDGHVVAKWLDNFIADTGGSGGLPIWITEVSAQSYKGKGDDGSITTTVDRRSAVGQRFTQLFFDDIMSRLATRPRVARLFYYHWQGDEHWDSGLIDLDPTDSKVVNNLPADQKQTAIGQGIPPYPNGQPRTILTSYKNLLNAESTFQAAPAGAAGLMAGSAAKTVTFTVSPDATTECQVDDGPWNPCTSPWDIGAVADGQHTWQVRALLPWGDGGTLTVPVNPDPVKVGGGNLRDRSDGTKAAGFTVDSTAPETRIDATPAAKTNATTASIAFSGTDAHAITYGCRLDGAAWSICSSPMALSGLTAGSHTLDVRATDEVGNVDATPASVTWRIDTTAPDTTISAGPAALTASTTGSVAFSSTDDDAVASYECKLDGGNFAACTSPWALSGISTGSHTAQVRAVDASGNVDASPATVSWVVDLAAPDTTISSGPPATTTATTASISFSGTDDTGVTSYECKLDSGSYAACTSPKSLIGLAVGSHTFSVRARDGAGNVDATPATTTWTVTTASAPAVLMGNQTVESARDSTSAGEIEAWPFASAAGTAVSASVYLDATSAAPNVKVGIYSNNSNRPSALLAQGTLSSPTAGGWVTVPLDAPLTVTSGTTYWVGMMSTGSGIRFRDHAVGGACTGHATGGGLSAPPATWGTDTYSGTDCPGSIYVNSGSGTADTTAPDTTLSSGPPASTGSTSASMVFSGTDNVAVSSYECKLDSGSYAACASPKLYTGLALGSHAFSVRARDVAGNIDATPATTTWTIVSGAAAVLMGNTTLETYADATSAGEVEAWPYTASSTGAASIGSVYLDASNTGTDLRVGLYTNNTDRPGTLLATGTLASPTAGAWNPVPLTTTPTLTSGTRYWIAVGTATGMMRIRDRTGGPCTVRQMTMTAGSTMPSMWGAEDYTGSECPASTYVSAP